MSTYLYAMKICLYFLIFFISSIKAQNYKEYHELVDKNTLTKDNDSIVFYLEKAISSVKKPFPKQLLSLGFQYYEKGNDKKAYNTFLRAIENGYQFESDMKKLVYYIEYNSNFIETYKEGKFPFFNYMNEMYSKNIKKIKKYRQKFLKKINKKQNETYEVFLQNEYYFQIIRLNILPERGVGRDTLGIVSKYLPSGNSYAMLKLLKQDNFPKRYNCARFNDHTITILLNHAISGFANKNDAEEFINLLWREVERGNITPYDYAKAYDHYVVWYVDDNRTYFGTTLTSIEGVEELVCKDVIYPEKLNEIRKKYWLINIESFTEKYGYKLPLNYSNK